MNGNAANEKLAQLKAQANGLPLVDFFTPTVEQTGLVVIRKKLDTVSDEGTRLLANMVADAIQNI